jgi:DNA repair protein RecN (Recombination protein N)
MLVSVAIKNFAIVRQLEVHWHQAMTTITGETGAGKSIAIDALSLALGERADASVVRKGADKAEVIASFDVSQLPQAQSWLKEQELDFEHDCILRRVVSKEGRSKAYINGSPVPASQLKSIGAQLVSIHGQHAHTQLTKPDYQRSILDEFGGHQKLASQVSAAFTDWQKICAELEQLRIQAQEHSATKQLLEYQVNELIEAELQPNEFEQVESEHRRLHHANSLKSDTLQAINILYENEQGNAYSALQQAISNLANSASIDASLNSSLELINGSLIQLEEGITELRHYSDELELNPEYLEQVESRMALLVDLARKHKVEPQHLVELQESLTQQLNELEFTNEKLEQLQLQKDQTLNTYNRLAEKLSNARRKSAKALSNDISASMQSLNMSGAQCQLSVSKDEGRVAKDGFDVIEFLVCANLGQSLQPLSKVASGGELSRISLAIQVIIAEKVTTPTLLFDEVDVGVSGPTATAVGRLMKKLSQKTQVICVTHLPQVACFGEQQQFVKKQTIGNETETQMQLLDEQSRINELARLLGGEVISETTKANAKELLELAVV